MCCCHSPVKSPGSSRRRWLGDDRGAATVEGILVFAMLAGVLLGVMLLGQWGERLQYSQMGARLLAFDAGDTSLAKFGRGWDQASRTVVQDSITWDTYFGTLPVDWFNALFVLPNVHVSSNVQGTQQGRLPSRGQNLFEFSRASLNYRSGASAASNPWADTTADVELTFLGITYWVGYNRSMPGGLDSVPVIPPSGLPLLESIYARLGVR